MQVYDKYKDSGIEWLGEIPEHWEVRKLKYVFDKIQTGTTPPTSNQEYFAGNENWFNPKDLNSEILCVSEKKISQKAIEENQIKMFDGDSILIVGIGATAGKTSYLPIRGTFNQQITGFKSTNNFNKYYFFLLKNLSGVFLSLAQYTTLPILNNEFFKSVRLTCPPLPEQEAIAAFLDDKCGKIDEAVRIKQQQIEKLKELRQITIHNAVTKGIDPEAEMKDSGIDWIGKIPKHWEMKRLKYVTSKIGSGITPSGGGETYLDEGIPLLRSQNVHFDKIDLNNVAFISRKTHESMANSIVKKWDVLLNITGGSIGRCNVVTFDLEMNVNQHVCIVRPTQIKPEFLNYLLVSDVGQCQIWYYQQGGGREGLNFQNLKNFDLSYPPPSEQEEIVTYLEEQTTKIDKAIALKTEQIAKLNEYKQSLINDVVTGKIKVTN